MFYNKYLSKKKLIFAIVAKSHLLLFDSGAVNLRGAVTLQLVDKDNRDVCDLSAVDPPPNCKLASALS